MRRLSLILLAFMALGWQTVAVAWNKSGHMVAASMAYRELKTSNPTKLKALLKILEEHPNYQTSWLPVLNEMDPADREQALFLLAARWPDDVREPFGNHAHRRVWHFADQALKFPGTPADVPDGILVPDKQPGDIDEGITNLLDALKHNRGILAGQMTNDKKAVALCWILHLGGDVHQPLHVTTRFSDLQPKGDRGGNSTFISIPPRRTALHYHTFWDDIVLTGPKNDELFGPHASDPDVTAESVTGAIKRGAILFANPNFARAKFPQLGNTDPASWPEEGLAIGRKVAYLNMALTGGVDAHDPFEMPAGFSKTAKAVAESQVALAGHRLADMLGD
jgi:hypothetical protein